MTLQDLKKGQMVTLEVVWGETKYDIQTEVVGATKDALLILPFSYKGTTLDLGSGKFKSMTYNLHVADKAENDRKVWRSVIISTVKVNDMFFYAVKLSAMGHIPISSDRRENKRLVLDVKGSAIVRGSDKSVPVIVHDISDGGLSFFAASGFNPGGKILRITYDDVVQGHGFTLNIECVRVREMDDGAYTLLGCKITNMDKDLLAYVCLRKSYEESLR